ncbi:MAG: PAS domain S-box protein [Actinomycetes bacterium]
MPRTRPTVELDVPVWEVLGAARTPMLVTGPGDGTTVWANDAAITLLGRELDEVVGRPPAALGLPPVVSELLAQAAAAGGEDTVEGVVDLPEGLGPVEVAVRTLSGGGAVITLVPVGTAGSDRMLDAADERFRALFDRAPIGLAIGTAEGTVIDANPALCRMVGRQRSAIVGGSFDALRDTAEVPAADLRPLLDRTVPSLLLERTLRHADGRGIPTRITLSLLGRGTGHETRVVAIVQDLSVERAAELARSMAQERFRAVFEHAPIGQALTTRTGEMLQVNRALAELLGRDIDDIVGRHLLTFTHPDDAQLSVEVLERLRAEGGHAEFEKRYVRPSGEIVHALVSVAVAPRDGDEPGDFMALIQDVTERRRAAQQLGETLAALEERNADLQHFASVASHDLKAPLHTVKGFLELAQQEAERAGQDDVAHYVSRALAGTNRMRGLIDALLGFARSGTAALEPTEVDLVVVLERVTRSIGQALDERGASITVDGEVPLHADPATLEVLLQNLLANALQHAGERAAIRVNTEALDDGVVLRVCDDGPGIAEADRDRVFEMFEHGRRGTHGAGIGLATCARIVERHGGRIWVEETPGGGATIAAWFPSPS